ncbi:hypothetical protein Tco_0268134 [Tanacetum coccineum]
MSVFLLNKQSELQVEAVSYKKALYRTALSLLKTLHLRKASIDKVPVLQVQASSDSAPKKIGNPLSMYFCVLVHEMMFNRVTFPWLLFYCTWVDRDLHDCNYTWNTEVLIPEYGFAVTIAAVSPGLCSASYFC